MVVWGKGRKYPASNTEGAKSIWIDNKICQVELIKKDGTVETIRENKLLKIGPGERIRTTSAGGGAGPDAYRLLCGAGPTALKQECLCHCVPVRIPPRLPV